MKRFINLLSALEKNTRLYMDSLFDEKTIEMTICAKSSTTTLLFWFCIWNCVTDGHLFGFTNVATQWTLFGVYFRLQIDEHLNASMRMTGHARIADNKLCWLVVDNCAPKSVNYDNWNNEVNKSACLFVHKSRLNQMNFYYLETLVQ